MTSNLNAASLFRVDGMVAVITGGGTGKAQGQPPISVSPTLSTPC
jgi:hypothetical protein